MILISHFFYSLFFYIFFITLHCNLGCCKIAENHTYFVIGFVSQSNVSSDPRFILLTPGVQLDKSVDGLGQQVRAKSVAVFMKYLSIAFGSRYMRGLRKFNIPGFPSGRHSPHLGCAK